ncbi:hypothetical protein ACTMSW_24935 [Micromonospora sp. BQ11]|uniref:hypothetical protein n=1 Tax=Micromonospora sp. BQ11 TaxID=3452212 RepID=UPI003F89723A
MLPMLFRRGGADNGHSAASDAGPGWHQGWWGQLFGLVATVTLGHVLVLVMTWLHGAKPPRDFSLGGFAFVWVMVAAGVSLWEWWNYRSVRQRQGTSGWRDGGHRWSRVATSIPFICWIATWLSGYLTAFEGELPLIWADVMAALTFVSAAVARRLFERHKAHV